MMERNEMLKRLGEVLPSQETLDKLEALECEVALTLPTVGVLVKFAPTRLPFKVCGETSCQGPCDETAWQDIVNHAQERMDERTELHQLEGLIVKHIGTARGLSPYTIMQSLLGR